MALAASAVRATVAEALRVGKTACHGHHFTAIRGPDESPVRLIMKTRSLTVKSPRPDTSTASNNLSTRTHTATAR